MPLKFQLFFPPIDLLPLLPFLIENCCSVAQSCPTLCGPVDCIKPGFPVHQQLPELGESHVHRVGDAIQPSHPLSSPLLLPSIFPAPGSFLMSRLFASGAKVLELQHQSFQCQHFHINDLGFEKNYLQTRYFKYKHFRGRKEGRTRLSVLF